MTNMNENNYKKWQTWMRIIINNYSNDYNNILFYHTSAVGAGGTRTLKLVRKSSKRTRDKALVKISDICWWEGTWSEYFPLSQATLLYCDNVSAIYLSGNPVQHQRTKHVEMDIHFVREKIARGQAPVLHVPSHHQIADIFTKAISRVLFDDFRTSLSVR